MDVYVGESFKWWKMDGMVPPPSPNPLFKDY